MSVASVEIFPMARGAEGVFCTGFVVYGIIVNIISSSEATHLKHLPVVAFETLLDFGTFLILLRRWLVLA